MNGVIFSPIPLYRVAHWIHKRGQHHIAYLVYGLNYFLTGCQIPASVEIGQRARIPDFGAGVVINGSTIIGDDVMILPHVVIGQNIRQGLEVIPGKVVIGNRVVLGTGAKIIASGILTIEDDAIVGANAVVLKSVPAGHMAIGIPARNVPAGKGTNGKTDDNLGETTFSGHTSTEV